jgi:hypothetical protein
MKNEPQPEYAEALTREELYRSEREATRADAHDPEVAAEERDWEAVGGDGIELRAVLADQEAQAPNFAQAIRRRFESLGGVELRLSPRQPMMDP